MSDELDSVYLEISVHDPVYKKFKCPICKGYREVDGVLIGPSATLSQTGKCYYCNGTGIARVKRDT